MERIELDDGYGMSAEIALLRERARRRERIAGVVFSAIVVVVLFVALRPAVGPKQLAASLSVLVVLVLAVALAASATGRRGSMISRVGPAAGLPFAMWHRAMRGIRQGRLDEDPLLHEVQLVEVGRLYDRRKDVWLLPVLTLCWAAQAVLNISVTLTVAYSVLTGLFTVLSVQIFANLRGAKRILAVG